MYWKFTALQIMVSSAVRVQSGRVAVCISMRPARRDKCSSALHWPLGCDSRTGQGTFEYAGTMRDEKALGVLAVAMDSARDECGCSPSCYRQRHNVMLIFNLKTTPVMFEPYRVSKINGAAGVRCYRRTA